MKHTPGVAPMRNLRILFSYQEPTERTNPFTALLSAHLSRHVSTMHFSPLAALIRPFDILHFHWPENVFVGTTPTKTVLKTFLGIWLLARTVVQRIPIVLTKHNLRPHETSRNLHLKVYEWIESRASAVIYLNESTENKVDGVTILHGLYPRTANTPTLSRTRNNDVQLLTFGLIRRYKGIDSLLTSLRTAERRDLRLVVRGLGRDSSYVEELESLANRDARIDFHSGFLSEQELETEIDNCDIVVLPYRQLYNSGAALLALSRCRPVLVPDTPSTRSLQSEFGADFVRLFDSKLTPQDLSSVEVLSDLAACNALTTDRRAWTSIATLHHALYQSVWQHRRKPLNAARRLIRREIASDPRFVLHSARNGLTKDD